MTFAHWFNFKGLNFAVPFRGVHRDPTSISGSRADLCSCWSTCCTYATPSPQEMISNTANLQMVQFLRCGPQSRTWGGPWHKVLTPLDKGPELLPSHQPRSCALSPKQHMDLSVHSQDQPAKLYDSVGFAAKASWPTSTKGPPGSAAWKVGRQTEMEVGSGRISKSVLWSHTS